MPGKSQGMSLNTVFITKSSSDGGQGDLLLGMQVIGSNLGERNSDSRLVEDVVVRDLPGPVTIGEGTVSPLPLYTN